MQTRLITFIALLATLTGLPSHGFPPLKWNIESKSSRLGRLPECALLLPALRQLEEQVNALEAEAIVQGKESVVYAKMTFMRELLKNIWNEVDSFSCGKSEETVDREMAEVSLFLERLLGVVSEPLKDPEVAAVINQHRHNHHDATQQKAIFLWSFVSGAYVLSGPTYFFGTLGISITAKGWKLYEKLLRDTKSFLAIDALRQALETARNALKVKYATIVGNSGKQSDAK